MTNGTASNEKPLLKRIEDALQNLLTLKVVTLVGPLDVTANGESFEIVPHDPTASDGIATSIRLEQGDITNVMSGNAFDNKALFEFHAQQVALSRQIVGDNMKAVLDLARSLTS